MIDSLRLSLIKADPRDLGLVEEILKTTSSSRQKLSMIMSLPSIIQRDSTLNEIITMYGKNGNENPDERKLRKSLYERMSFIHDWSGPLERGE